MGGTLGGGGRLASGLGALWVAAVLGSGAAAEGARVEDFARLGSYELVEGDGELGTGRAPGFHWLELATAGTGAAQRVETRGALDPPLDTRGRFLRSWLRVDDLRALGGIELRLFSDGGYFAYPVPHFADPEFNLLESGGWVPLTVSFASFRAVGEPRRDAVTRIGLYVRDSGRGQPLELRWGGFALTPAPPRGLLSFTFDDGYAEHARVAAPVLAEAGFRGTAYVMPEQIGQHRYVSRAQLRELRDRYGWDVGSHHARPLTEWKQQGALEQVLLGIQSALAAHRVGAGYRHLAYPLGRHDTERVLPLARKHFATARLASGGVETLPPADPHKLRVVNVLGSTQPEEIGALARRVHGEGGWAILMFHFLEDDPAQPPDPLVYGVDALRRLVAEVRESGVEVATVSEVWDRPELSARPTPGLPAPPNVPAARTR